LNWVAILTTQPRHMDLWLDHLDICFELYG